MHHVVRLQGEIAVVEKALSSLDAVNEERTYEEEVSEVQDWLLDMVADGKAEINEAVWETTVDLRTTTRRTADVVQIHSDPAKTVPLKVRRPKDFEYLTRAMIRY